MCQLLLYLFVFTFFDDDTIPVRLKQCLKLFDGFSQLNTDVRIRHVQSLRCRLHNDGIRENITFIPDGCLH